MLLQLLGYRCVSIFSSRYSSDSLFALCCENIRQWTIHSSKCSFTDPSGQALNIILVFYFSKGLLENVNGVRDINCADILLNEFPLTLLDLSQRGKIKFSGNVHEHYRSKQRHAREQEFNIIQRREPNIPFSTE